METRKLVTLRTIDNITPIENADSIETAHLGGWQVVVGKNEFVVGQEILYFEVDSMLPLENCPFEPKLFSFLEPRGVKEQNGIRYHRLKTAKLRGQISQGLIMPIPETLEKLPEGSDYANLFGVVKYEPPVPAELRGKVYPFPEWISKTDEERVQNLDKEVVEEILAKKSSFVATEKIDGTSTTIWAKKQPDGVVEYGVCSRNNGIIEDDNNTYWKVVRATKIGDDFVLDWVKAIAERAGSCVLQGELFGESVQNNVLGVKGQTIRFFNLFVDGDQIPLSSIQSDAPELLEKWVPIHKDYHLADTIDEMVLQPDGVKTLVPEATKLAQIEGFVWRCWDTTTLPYKTIDISKVPPEKRKQVLASKRYQDVRASFKCISNKYLLKHE